MQLPRISLCAQYGPTAGFQKDECCISHMISISLFRFRGESCLSNFKVTLSFYRFNEKTERSHYKFCTLYISFGETLQYLLLHSIRAINMLTKELITLARSGKIQCISLKIKISSKKD